MNFNKLFMAAFAVAAVSACTAEVENIVDNPSAEQSEGVYMEFDASMTPGTDTKATIVSTGQDSDGKATYAVEWHAGDEISLFYGSGSNGGSKFTSNATERATTTKFTGYIDVVTGAGEDTQDETSFWAVYPYNEANSCDGNSVTLVIPSEQTAVAEGVAPNTLPAIAKSSGLLLSFYQVCAYIKFTVTQTGIEKVAFTNATDDYIAGTVTCTFGDNGKPELTKRMLGSRTVTVSAPDGGTFEVGKNYYAVLAPVDMENGMLVTYMKSDEQATRTITGAVSMSRGVVNKVTGGDANLVWELRDYCLTFSMESGSNTLSLDNKADYGDPNQPNVQYSYDKIVWKDWDYSALEFSEDRPLYIRGENSETGFSHIDDQNHLWSTFKFSAPGASVDGDIMSLISYDYLYEEIYWDGCFYSLFEYAPIVKAPELPAMMMSLECYAYMFSGCTLLEEAPELPADELDWSCYAFMFDGCTSLTKAPVLPAKFLMPQCYHMMFWGCTSLNYVEAYFTDWYQKDKGKSWTDSTSGWLNKVAEEGTFIMSEDATWDIVIGPSGIPEGWTSGIAVPDYLCFTAEEANSTISMKTTNEPTTLPTLQYSCDGLRWNDFVVGSTSVVLAEVGDKVYLRGDNERINSSKTNYVSFDISGEVSASGNILSLLSKSLAETDLKSYVFYGLFKDCTGLKSAPELPGNTTAPLYGYGSMFEGCSSLNTAPVLTATNLGVGCYHSMFKNSGLTSAPALPATSLSSDCYVSMFEGCTSLRAAPVLKATSLGRQCYQAMFKNSGIYSAPALPAMSLEQKCYESMFEGCRNLNKAPLLQATTLAEGCYISMFKDSFISTFPALPATTLYPYCYANMFEGTSGYHENGPALPATTLSNYCYRGMFKNCSLTHAPLLPATTLVEGCYQEMFSGCDFVDITVKFTNWNESAGATTDWLAGTRTHDYCSFYGPDDLERDKKDASHIPSNFIYKAPQRFLTFTTDNSNKNRMSFNSDNQPSFEYSYDMVHWISWTNLAEYLYFSAEEPLYLRGSNSSRSTLGTFRFNVAEPVHVTGNIMHLLSYDESLSEIRGASTFKGLFKDCTQLVQAPSLPATKLDWNCYEGMFEGCSSLTLAPVLPAKTLERYCYTNMFKGCTSLIGLEVPNLGGYDVSEALEDMILATDISSDAYNCFASMFEGCTSLTRTPLLRSKQLVSHCYDRMFYGCSSLSRVYAAFEYFYLGQDGRASTGYIDDWLYGVSSSGTFYHNRWSSNAPADFESNFPRSASSIPANWTLAEYIWWN